MVAFEDVPDRSLPVTGPPNIVNLNVGTIQHRRFFQIHLNRLGPLRDRIRRAQGNNPGQTVSVSVLPNIFNLAMHWSYGSPLPRISDFARYFDQTYPIFHPLNPASPLRPPLLTSIGEYQPFTEPGPVVVEVPQKSEGTWSYQCVTALPEYRHYSIEELRLYSTRAEGNSQSSDSDQPAVPPLLPKAGEYCPYTEPAPVFPRVAEGTWLYQCVTTLPKYRQFSIEELRLHFTEAEGNGQSSDSHRPGDASGDDQIQDRERILAKCNDASTCPTIPFVIPIGEALRADREQTMLLRLMIFADQNKWETLFNDAIDAYWYGETSLRRSYVPVSHLLIASQECRWPSLVQLFIVDYALTLGYKNNKMSKYYNMMLRNPDISYFMVTRTDSDILADLVATNGPPDRAGLVKLPYHLHDAEFVRNCSCPSRVKRASTQTDSLKPAAGVATRELSLD